jgi:zinc protease
LYLESDRMRSLAVNQSNLDNQRNAVQEERRLGEDNQPYGHAYLDIDNLAYDNFAYKHSTIGEMADLNAASVDDVKDFFRIYYAPNNAVVTLVGDLDPAQTLAKVKKYFGGIPSQPVPPPVDMTEPPHYGERSETIKDPLARTPLVLMAYHIPAGNTPDNYAVRVLASVLGQGQSSRLYQHLVKEKQVATQVFAQAESRRGPSLLYLYAFLRPGVKPEDGAKAIRDEIAAVQKDGITARELEKARIQFLRQQIGSRQADLGTAQQIGQYAVYFDDPNLINTIVDKFDVVTADQVRRLPRSTWFRSSSRWSRTFRPPSRAHLRKLKGRENNHDGKEQACDFLFGNTVGRAGCGRAGIPSSPARRRTFQGDAPQPRSGE